MPTRRVTIHGGRKEQAELAAIGQKTWVNVFGSYIVPTLIGNILGGVALVATLNHAQVVAGGGGEDI